MKPGPTVNVGPSPRPMSDDGIRVWVNGKQVHSHEVGRRCRPHDAVPLKLKAGTNRIFVKVDPCTGEWGL